MNLGTILGALWVHNRDEQRRHRELDPAIQTARNSLFEYEVLMAGLELNSQRANASLARANASLTFSEEAKALLASGRVEEALRPLEKALSLLPGGRVASLRAALLLTLRRHEAASAAFDDEIRSLGPAGDRKSLKLDHHGYLLSLLASGTLLGNRLNEFERVADQFGTADCRLDLAVALAVVGRPDDAFAVADGVLRAHPKHPRVVQVRDWLARISGQYIETTERRLWVPTGGVDSLRAWYAQAAATALLQETADRA